MTWSIQIRTYWDNIPSQEQVEKISKRLLDAGILYFDVKDNHDEPALDPCQGLRTQIKCLERKNLNLQTALTSKEIEVRKLREPRFFIPVPRED